MQGLGDHGEPEVLEHPTTHRPAGSQVAPSTPGCPAFASVSREPSGCGLKGVVAERARNYQLNACDAPLPPHAWAAGETPRDHVRTLYGADVSRVSAHMALRRTDPDRHTGADLLRKILNLDDEHLRGWRETADFQANGYLRLLFLFSSDTGTLPCDLQNIVRERLLGFKYSVDEPARHPDPSQEAVYWSENHQVLYATAEYLAGQLMPGDTFRPTVRWRESKNDPWAVNSNPAWEMTGTQRMDRAYPRLVHWLEHRLMFGFSEWHSPVYNEYDVLALLNLVDFCEDEQVQRLAAQVLDLLLLDWARCHIRGVLGGSAGRHYGEQKRAGWQGGELLHILFGRRSIDSGAEDRLEALRLLDRPALRAPIETNKDLTAAERVVALAEFDWMNPPDKLPSPSTVWGGANSIGAHALATTTRYCLPEVITEIGAAEPPAWVDLSRVSLDFADAAAYNMGFVRDTDVLDWWSRGAFGAPPVIALTRKAAKQWGLQKVTPFKSITGLFILPVNELELAAANLPEESLGSCLTRAHRYTYRDPEVMLSSVQNFHVGQVGRQAHIWQAVIDPYVSVWTTFPAAEEDSGDGPNWWTGNVHQPKVFQVEDALICAYAPPWLPNYTEAMYSHRNHAWFPFTLFDETREERGHSANCDGVWFLGRRGDAYVGLFSAQEETYIQTTGRWAHREILCENLRNVWICQVGNAARFGSFDDFVRACQSATIHVSKGVFEPWNPFVDVECSYDIPGKHRMELHWDEQWPRYHYRLSEIDFPRMTNSYGRIEFDQRAYAIQAAGKTLTHDQRTLDRTGDGIA